MAYPKGAWHARRPVEKTCSAVPLIYAPPTHVAVIVNIPTSKPIFLPANMISSVSGDFSDDFFKNYDAPDSNRLVFDNKQPLRREQYLKAKEMMDSIPDIIFKSDSKIFGEPDDRDQCGIFFQIKIKDKLKTFYIDTDINAIPIELRNFANRLMDNWYENAHKLK